MNKTLCKMGAEQKSFEIWAKRRRISICGGGLASFLICCFFLIISTQGARVPGVDRECNSIANMIKGKGFTYPWWVGSGGVFGSSSPANSSSMLSCPIGKSGERSTKCCKELDASIQRTEMSSAFNEKWLGPKLTANGDIFKERKKKFDVTFKDLLTRAHAAFHAMFERTYGMLYIQHAPIFHALFTTLEAYYDNGRDSLEGKLNEFFAILTRKMFVVLNSQYEFDDAYLSCATIVITEKQGGDLHRQIVSSLRRSFVATRALAQGLNDADRVFNNLHKLKMSPECISSLTHMLQCPICTELRAFKPCSPLCNGITSQCLSGTMPLVKAWTEFSNAMENILDRLLGPYNVEAVVEPIHIKISEAIMNFQESGPDLSQAVFAKCGKAKLKSAKNFRKREAVSPAPENLRRRPDEIAPKIGTQLGPVQADSFRASTGHDDTQPSKSLEKLLREVKNKVKKSKNVWDSLPRQVCNGISKDYSSQLCWNGSTAIKPDKNKTNENQDFRSSLGKGAPSLLVSEQIIILQQITEKLRASFNGLDVQWVQESDDLDFDGSGMGSGSGEMPTDLEDSDDDDPSGQINPERKPPTENTNFHPPSHPKFPVRPPPPILKPLPNHEDEEDEEDEEDSSEEDDNLHGTNNNVNWNTDSSSNPTDMFGNTNNNNRGGVDFSTDDDDDDGIDFVPKYNPPIVPDPPTTTSTTTTTTTTRRPIDVTKKKHPSTSSASMDEAKKAVAFFKLFSPIFASMVGKAFSFT